MTSLFDIDAPAESVLSPRTFADVLADMEQVGASLLWTNNRLTVTPKGTLTDALRADLRAFRHEAEQYAKENCGSLLDAVLAVFHEATIDEYAALYAAHVPGTIVPTCYTIGGECRENGCGDCDLFAADKRIAKLREARLKTEATERARNYANYAAHRDSGGN